jgi:hypothetical protein
MTPPSEAFLQGNNTCNCSREKDWDAKLALEYTIKETKDGRKYF